MATSGRVSYYFGSRWLELWVSPIIQPGARYRDCSTLTTLKTCAKDDVEKTYWIYPTEKVVDHFEKKHVLEITPFVIFAKNFIVPSMSKVWLKAQNAIMQNHDNHILNKV